MSTDISSNSNNTMLKTLLKTLGYASAAFLGGFLIYTWKQSHDEEVKPEVKTLDEEKLLKLLNKIRNLCIHIMVQHYDKKTKIKGRKPIDDIVIDNSPGETTSASIGACNEISKKEESKVDEDSGEAFDLEMYQILLEIEMDLAQRVGLNLNEYFKTLEKYIQNEKVKSIIETLDRFKKALKHRRLPEVKFGSAMTKDYLKIISNIYYLNLRKVQKQYKEKFADISGVPVKEAQEIFNKIYKENLKETRSQVLKFFNVTHGEDMPSKLLLRIYPMYFEKDHDLRKSYDKMGEEVNNVIAKIILDGCIDELYDDRHPRAFVQPTNVLIDFTHLLTPISSSEPLEVLQKITPETRNSERAMDDEAGD